MSSNEERDQNEPDLERWYSGYLLIERPSEDVARRLSEFARELPYFDVSPTAIELDYRGRDSSQFIVRGLLRLAQLVGTASGEIVCQVSGDADQLWFEFYRIRRERLFRQFGKVVRQPEDEVTSPG